MKKALLFGLEFCGLVIRGLSTGSPVTLARPLRESGGGGWGGFALRNGGGLCIFPFSSVEPFVTVTGGSGGETLLLLTEFVFSTGNFGGVFPFVGNLVRGGLLSTEGLTTGFGGNAGLFGRALTLPPGDNTGLGLFGDM